MKVILPLKGFFHCNNAVMVCFIDDHFVVLKKPLWQNCLDIANEANTRAEQGG